MNDSTGPAIISNSSNDQSKLFFDAIYTANVDEVRKYFEDQTINPKEWKDEEGFTCLHRATYMNLYLVVEVIIQEVLDRDGFEELTQFINLPSLNGLRAIHFASYRGNIELIKFLILNGANFNLTNNRGLNVIHMAAQGDQTGSLIFFREKYNFDIFLKDNLGNTALNWACYMGSETFFSFFISYLDETNKEIINCQDIQGLSPLHLSVISEKSKLIKKLLHKGADSNIKDKKNRTPYELAVEKKKENIIEMLKVNKSCILFSDVMNPNLKKTERTSFNLILFIILHLLIETVVFFLILPHFGLPLFNIYFVALFTIVMLLFFILINSDPGLQGFNLITYTKGKNEVTPRRILLDLVEKNLLIDDYCPYCIIVKNEAFDIKHCYYCNRCVKGYDHHCYWVNNCIGENNYNTFFVFLTFVSINLITQIYIGFHGIFVKNDNKPSNESIFPPYIALLDKYQLYEKNVKIVLCCILMITCYCFVIPVEFLWFKNLKILFLKIKKQKKKDRKASANSIIDKVHEDVIDEEAENRLIIK